MSGPGWDTGPSAGEPRSRIRIAVMLVAAVAVTGLLARPTGSQPTGTIDIDSASPSDSPTPTPSSTPTTTPTPTPTPRPTRTQPPRSTPTPTPTPELAAGDWEPLPEAPIETRREHAAVWTGQELLVWGGVTESFAGPGQVFRADGAALQPATGSWRTLPEAPLVPRTAFATAWTGAEMVVWGGYGRHAQLGDGAAYDPATDGWRAIAPSPLSPRSGAAAAWSGTEMLVVGGHDNAGSLSDGAAYDPVTDAWRPLPPLPAGLGPGWAFSGLWTAAGAVVWAPEGGGPTTARAALLDRASEQWILLPDPPSGGGQGSFYASMAWTGEELLAIRGTYDAGRPKLVRWTPGAAEWGQLDDPPPSLESWATTGVWTGDQLILVGGEGTTTGAVYDLARGTWSRLPSTVTVGGGWGSSRTWTGEALLVWGGQGGDAGANAGSAWRFGDPPSST